jgi:uncharacterized membrane protein
LKARALGWGLLAFLSTGVAAYASAVLVVPSFGPPFVGRLRAETPIPILTHIAASLVALAIGPWQFNARLRNRALTLHRWLGRTYIVSVVVGGTAGLVLARTSQEGIVTHLGFGFLAVAWVFATIRAYLAIRGGDEVRHRAWMIRSFALTFAAVTLRNILPLELASGVPFPVAYKIVAWACWLPNLAVAEWIVRRQTRGRPRPVFAAVSIVVLVSAPALARAQAPSAWPDTFTTRLEALALMQTLNAQLLASRSSTATLEAWCGDHHLAPAPQIVADAVAGAPAAPSSDQLQRLEVATAGDVKYRHVRLRCGTHVLSEADNWYVPARLTADMNHTLETTDAPFGRVVAPLQPYRRTFSMTLLWLPLPDGWERGIAGGSDGGGGTLAIPAALFEHRAVLYTRDNRPFSEVREVYQRDVLALPVPPAR